MLVELISIEKSDLNFKGHVEAALKNGTRRSPLGGNLTNISLSSVGNFQMIGNTSSHDVMNIIGKKEREFVAFDLQIAIHANLKSSKLREDVFFYEFGRAAFRSLSRLSWRGPPYSRVTETFPIVVGRSIKDGSIIADVTLGAAAVVTGVMAYPKFSLGVKSIVSDLDNLRKWSLRALEKRQVFKDFE
tara:strand:- start:452 stop:1015 length:564 start_codon:yes stop_codon:yes gene_type:complete